MILQLLDITNLMLSFLIGIICILLHRPKKLTLMLRILDIKQIKCDRVENDICIEQNLRHLTPFLWVSSLLWTLTKVTKHLEMTSNYYYI